MRIFQMDLLQNLERCAEMWENYNEEEHADTDKKYEI
jgi:hypothetical protein